MSLHCIANHVRATDSIAHTGGQADPNISSRNAASCAGTRRPRREELPPSLQWAQAGALRLADPKIRVRPASTPLEPTPLVKSRRPTRLELTTVKRLIRDTSWGRDELSAYGMAKGLQPLEKFIDANGHARGAGKTIKRLDKLAKPDLMALIAVPPTFATVGLPLVLAYCYRKRIERWWEKRETNVYKDLTCANRRDTLDEIGFVPPSFSAALNDIVVETCPPPPYLNTESENRRRHPNVHQNENALGT